MPFMELFRGDGRLTWQLRFTDQRGLRRQLSTRVRDRSTAMTVANKIERLVNTRIRGDVLAADLRSWSAGLHKETREKLADWQLLEAAEAVGSRLFNPPRPDPLPPGWTDLPASWLELWKQALSDREVTEAHAQQTVRRVEQLLSLPVENMRPIVGPEDLSAEAVLARVRELRRVGAPHAHKKRKRKPAGPRTCQYYLERAREFCGWLVARGLLTANPLLNQVAYTEPVMRAAAKRRRRDLRIDQQMALIQAAETGGKVLGIGGAERALIYRFVLRSGLRADELSRLRARNFNWFSKTFTVLAGDSKARREETLPIAVDLVELLKTHMAAKHPEAQAFTPLPPKKYCTMLRTDLLAAKIPYLDDLGRYADFHALRHTYGTELAKVVMPAVHMQLMRHKDIRTTMDYYTHINLGDKVTGLAKLPSLATPAAAGKSAG